MGWWEAGRMGEGRLVAGEWREEVEEGREEVLLGWIRGEAELLGCISGEADSLLVLSSSVFSKVNT